MTLQDEITAQTLKTVKQAQDITIGAINTVAERVAPLLPKVPQLENLPKPAEVVEKAFGLSELLLASAKNVALEATKAFTPEAPKAAKPAAKPTAKKPVAAAAPAAE
jgi:hypothetical protein